MEEHEIVNDICEAFKISYKYQFMKSIYKTQHTCMLVCESEKDTESE